LHGTLPAPSGSRIRIFPVSRFPIFWAIFFIKKVVKKCLKWPF
jgi:hypothetical protein